MRRRGAQGDSLRVVIATTAEREGGVWRHVMDLARGLDETGMDVRVALRARSQDLTSLAQRADLRTVSLRQALRLPCDIWHLHLHDTYDPLALPLLVARRGRGDATLVTEHLPHSNASDPSLLGGGRTPGAARAKWLLKRAHFTLATRVIVVSDASRTFLERRYGLGSSRISVVYCGIPATPHPSPAAFGTSLMVVAVGSLIVQKGHDVLIRAAAEAREPWQVSIVGTGPARPELQRLADEIAPGRVRLVGWCADIAHALSSADVVCLPSRWESLPYAAIEAAVAARPVVASDVDGLRELVIDGETGYLVAAEDPLALARVLDHLAANRDTCRAMGIAARRRAVSSFSLERMIEQTVAVYRQAVGSD